MDHLLNVKTNIGSNTPDSVAPIKPISISNEWSLCKPISSEVKEDSRPKDDDFFYAFLANNENSSTSAPSLASSSKATSIQQEPRLLPRLHRLDSSSFDLQGRSFGQREQRHKGIQLGYLTEVDRQYLQKTKTSFQIQSFAGHRGDAGQET